MSTGLSSWNVDVEKGEVGSRGNRPLGILGNEEQALPPREERGDIFPSNTDPLGTGQGTRASSLVGWNTHTSCPGGLGGRSGEEVGGSGGLTWGRHAQSHGGEVGSGEPGVMTTDTPTRGTDPEREAECETEPVPLPLQMKDSYLILDEYVSAPHGPPRPPTAPTAPHGPRVAFMFPSPAPAPGSGSRAWAGSA